MKQITQIVHNKVKNPNWSEANQLAVNKRGGGFELGLPRTIQLAVRVRLEFEASGFQVRRLRIWTGDYWEQIQLAVRGGLELGASEFQVRRSRIWTRDYWEQIQLAVRGGWTRYLPNASPAL